MEIVYESLSEADKKRYERDAVKEREDFVAAMRDNYDDMKEHMDKWRRKRVESEITNEWDVIRTLKSEDEGGDGICVDEDDRHGDVIWYKRNLKSPHYPCMIVSPSLLSRAVKSSYMSRKAKQAKGGGKVHVLMYAHSDATTAAPYEIVTGSELANRSVAWEAGVDKNLMRQPVGKVSDKERRDVEVGHDRCVSELNMPKSCRGKWLIAAVTDDDDEVPVDDGVDTAEVEEEKKDAGVVGGAVVDDGGEGRIVDVAGVAEGDAVKEDVANVAEQDGGNVTKQEGRNVAERDGDSAVQEEAAPPNVTQNPPSAPKVEKTYRHKKYGVKVRNMADVARVDTIIDEALHRNKGEAKKVKIGKGYIMRVMKLKRKGGKSKGNADGAEDKSVAVDDAPRRLPPPTVTDASVFARVWPKLKEEGWTWANGTGLISYVYLPPNGSYVKSKSVRNVDYYDSEVGVLESLPRKGRNDEEMEEERSWRDKYGDVQQVEEGGGDRKRRRRGSSTLTAAHKVRCAVAKDEAKEKVKDDAEVVDDGGTTKRGDENDNQLPDSKSEKDKASAIAPAASSISECDVLSDSVMTSKRVDNEGNGDAKERAEGIQGKEVANGQGNGKENVSGVEGKAF